jgi:hypothetical protein
MFSALFFPVDLAPLFSFQIETMIIWPILTVNMISVQRRNAEKTNFECWFHQRARPRAGWTPGMGKFIHTDKKMQNRSGWMGMIGDQR